MADTATESIQNLQALAAAKIAEIASNPPISQDNLTIMQSLVGATNDENNLQTIYTAADIP